MWYDHMHGCMLLISMLLEMDSLGDDNHPHVPCMHTGRNPGKPLPWVGMSLSPVSVGTVMSGMAWQGDMSGDSVG